MPDWTRSRIRPVGATVRRHRHAVIGGWLGSSLARNAAVPPAALLLAMLTGCGTSPEIDDSEARSSATQKPQPTDCPSVAVWDRLVGPNDEFEMAASPEEAVLEFSAEIGTAAAVTSAQAEASGDEVTVFVVDRATNESGAYRVVRESRGWSVDGGEGCGALGPDGPTCPIPSDAPEGDLQVTCMDPQPED